MLWFNPYSFRKSIEYINNQNTIVAKRDNIILFEINGTGNSFENYYNID